MVALKPNGYFQRYPYLPTTTVPLIPWRMIFEFPPQSDAVIYFREERNASFLKRAANLGQSFVARIRPPLKRCDPGLAVDFFHFLNG